MPHVQVPSTFLSASTGECLHFNRHEGARQSCIYYVHEP